MGDARKLLNELAIELERIVTRHDPVDDALELVAATIRKVLRDNPLPSPPTTEEE